MISIVINKKNRNGSIVNELFALYLTMKVEQYLNTKRVHFIIHK